MNQPLRFAILLIPLILAACGPQPTADATEPPPATDLPIPTPTPAVEPKELADAEPIWTDGRYFPEFPPTDKITAIKVHTSPGRRYFPDSYDPEWQIDQSMEDMMALTLVGMQGVINRHGPKIFLNWQEQNSYAKYWLDRLESHVEIEYLEVGSQEAVDFLLTKYASAFSGVVIYDPEVPDTINLATMIAGLEDRVMLAPDQLEMWEFESVTDLRELVAQHGWGKDVESQTAIYTWAYDNLWPDLEHRMIGMISPGPTTSREMEPDLYWPMDFASRDYYVALRIPALYLHPVEDPQASLLRRFFEESESPIPMLGIFSLFEEGSVEIANEYGNFQVGVTWPGGVLSSGNLSVLSGVRPPNEQYEPEIRAEKILATIGSDPVAAIFSTDGDAIFYLMDHGFLSVGGWDEVQDQRFGWTINPTLIDLAPIVWNHYIEERNEVGLVSGLSGAGYAFPHVMSDEHLVAYLEHTAPYLTDSGLRVLHATLNDGDWDARMATRYNEQLTEAGLLGTIVGYGGQGGSSQIEFFDSPIPSVWPSYVLDGFNAKQIATDLLNQRADNLQFDIDDSHISPGVSVEQDAEALGGAAALVPTSFRESDACCLAVAAASGIVIQPGSNQVIFRLKIPEVEASESLVRIYIGFDTNGWRELATQTVATSDFSEANEYQDFSIEFLTEELISGAEIRVDYLASSTPILIDTIRFTNPDVRMPVFSLIRMSWDENVARAPDRFEEPFEQGGGVLLTVDEFMAALNPDFMINFAAERLGSDHAGVVEAAQLLEQGEEFLSLMVVREALSNP